MSEDFVQRAMALIRSKAFAEAERLCETGPKDDPELLNVLGNARAAQGRVDDAEAAYRQALAIAPGFYKSLNNLANVKRTKGDLAEAADLYQKALEAEPTSHRAHANLGTTLLMLNRPAEAAASFARSLALSEGTDAVWSRYAVALEQSGSFEEACEAYDKALSLAPRAELHQAYGNMLADRGQVGLAIEHLERAAELQPSARILADLGIARHAGRRPGAIEMLRHSLALEPSAYANNALGVALLAKGETTEAIACLRSAVAEDPHAAELLANLADALARTGHVTEALDHLRVAVEHGTNPAVHSNLCFSLHYDETVSDEEIATEHRRWGERYADPITHRAQRPEPSDRDPARPLRVGYVSADVRQHSVAIFLEPILWHHDPNEVVVHVYANVAHPDAVTERFRKQLGPRYRDVRGLSDHDFAQRVRADEVDILVDLGAHTGDSRLLAMAQRPAPIQATYLGYPGTTGANAIDYRLTDPIADPPGMTESMHTEDLLRLATGAWCFGDPSTLPPIQSRDGDIVFGSFNNLAKIQPTVLQTWAQILNQVPGSRLLLKAKGLLAAQARSDLIATLGQYGVSKDRIEVTGWTSDRISHLQRYGDVDIALDTFPYNGTTTTCEALAMGVPVVTLAGTRHSGRVGASLLHRVGLSDLVADDVAGYVAKACELAADRERRTQLRKDLRSRMASSPLGDAKQFVPGLEDAYRTMWKRYLAESA